MLLWREGLPGWLSRAEQLFGGKPARLPSREPLVGTPALAHNLVARGFEDWVRVLSSLLSPAAGLVQHEG